MVTNHDRKSFGSHRKKFQKLLRWLALLTFLIRVQAFRDPLHGELLHVQIFMNDGPNLLTWMPSCSTIDLAEIWRSSKISSWMWSIISGVVTVLGHPGWGTSQVEKPPHLYWATQFWCWHMMVHVPLLFLSEWCEFPSVPCLARKKTWWQLMSRCYWNRTHHLTCFLSVIVKEKTCNLAHEQTPLSNDIIDSVQNWEVGQAKDLSAPRLSCLLVCVG